VVGRVHQNSVATTSWRVRPSNFTDLTFVVRLAERAFRIYGPYSFILGLAFLQQKVFTLVALDRKKRIGFAMLSSMQDEVELSALAVASDYRRKGVGRALLRAAVQWAAQRHARQVVLHTAEKNTGAQGLFLDEGFLVQGYVERFYPEGQAAISMSKRLG
jgi:ribosomal-protein-alanine N-acetyltransferase